jgi:serine-type D-Ala-D-Ala carboxypeptidase (penicillin-binding protein 5/6)
LQSTGCLVRLTMDDDPGTIGGAAHKESVSALGGTDDPPWSGQGDRKRSVIHRSNPSRVNNAKTIVTLVLMALALLLLPGGVGLDRAEAQRGATGGSSGARVPEPPEVEARAWILVDAESGRYLAGENPDEQLQIGSVNKIMTALVVLDEGVDLEEEVTVSSEAESFVGTTYSNVGLILGERVTARDLLTAALIPSGTDAAYALAEYTGDGSVENFVGMMNEEASALDLTNTNFETPAGLDTTGNYSSARDLAKLARESLEYPLFAELVGTSDATISTQNREIEIFSTNQLLTSYPPATGVKTGTTPQGGANLVSSAEAGNESYIAVVLGAEDEERFRASEAILEYAFARYESEALVSQDEVYEEAALPYRRGEFVELAAAEEVSAAVDDSSEVERRATIEELPPSAGAGEELGEVEVLVDGQSVGRSPLVAQEGYEEASLWDRAIYAAGSLLELARGALESLFG